MKGTKRLLLLAGAACVILCICVIGLVARGQRNKVAPREVMECVDAYMDAYRIGTSESVKHMYFRDDFIREAYIATNDRLLDFQLEGVERINADLYELDVRVKSEQGVYRSGDAYEQVFNFVARVDGQWRYLNGVGHIPDDLKENLDESKYIITGDNVVNPADIVGAIGEM